jgi:prepilin-type N-terminal cleavage/methylation domain-containing protein
MNTFKFKGFTLIELMIIVAIVGVLAAIATPQYLGYVTKTQVGEAFNLVNGSQSQLINAYIANTCATNKNNELVAASDYNGKFIASLTFAGTPDLTLLADGSAAKSTGCGISALFRGVAPTSEELRAKQITFLLMRSSGAFRLVCLKLDSSLLPPAGLTGTTVPNSFLPNACE